MSSFKSHDDGTVKAWKWETVTENGRTHDKLFIQLKKGKNIPTAVVNAIASDESFLYFDYIPLQSYVSENP